MEFVNVNAVKQEHFDSEDEIPDYLRPDVPCPSNSGQDPLRTQPKRNQRGKSATGSKTRGRGGKVGRGRGAYIIKSFVQTASRALSKDVKPPASYAIPQIYHPALRMIDLNLIAHRLWCDKCNQALSLRNCVSDDTNACRTLLQVRCLKCSRIIGLTLTLLDTNGDLASYCTNLITKGSNLDLKSLADRCMEVGMQLEMLNSLIPRPDNRGRSRTNPTVHIPEDKILNAFST